MNVTVSFSPEPPGTLSIGFDGRDIFEDTIVAANYQKPQKLKLRLGDQSYTYWLEDTLPTMGPSDELA